MSWIREGDVPGLFTVINGLPDVIKVMSINPRAMFALSNMALAITFGASSLTRVQEEAIATAVSAANKCRYWTIAHGARLAQHSDDPELASHVMHDYTAQEDLDSQTRAMLDFAVKLTREPWTMQEADVQKLRSLGLNDEHILSVVLITCMFSFMDRLADGLGVELPTGRQEAIEQWLTGPATQQDWLMRARS